MSIDPELRRRSTRRRGRRRRGDARATAASRSGRGHAPDESTNWADGTTHEALQVIAEGITQLAGFDVAAVSVVRDSQHMQVMAVAGNDEARDILLGHLHADHPADGGARAGRGLGDVPVRPPREPRPRGPRAGAGCPTCEPIDGPDAWHPMDLLVAPLYGPNGELRGTLVDRLPVDGRRPDEAHRRILNRYAEQAGRALYIAVEREAFAEQVRVLSATRDVVRNAARERNIGVMLDKIQPQPDRRASAPSAAGSTPSTRTATALGAIYSGDGARVAMPRRAGGASPSAPPRTRGGPSGSDGRRGTCPTTRSSRTSSEPEFEQILRFLEDIGVGSLLFVPMGAGRECLGSLVLTRALGDAEWTAAEVDAAARGRPRPGPGGAQRPRARARARAGPRAQGARRLQEPS